MIPDIAIIGSGLTGLFAANLAIDAGLSVHLISRGHGGLSFSHGCIDVYHSSNPSRSIKSLPKNHPYQILPSSTMQSALKAFRHTTNEFGLLYTGGSSSSIPLLSPTGSTFRTSLVPQTMIKGRLDDTSPITVAGLKGFRDFWAESVANRAKQNGVKIRAVVELPLPPISTSRDLYATDIAEQLSDPSVRDELFRAWKPKLAGMKRVAIPAVFGSSPAETFMSEAEEFFGVNLFEVPTLPPSLPGLRLETTLMERLLRSSLASITQGPEARGRIDGRSKGKLAAGVQLKTAGGLRSIDSRCVLLASGGFLHGGLVAYPNGEVEETVFGIPVPVDFTRTAFTANQPWDPQPYASIGIGTDSFMRPLDARGKPFLENLFAAGGLLRGADRTSEGSRQGIDLCTAFHAIQSIIKILG